MILPAAQYAKLPIIPPFLQPSIQVVNGANFASGGAGVLSETSQGQVNKNDILGHHKSLHHGENLLIKMINM